MTADSQQIAQLSAQLATLSDQLRLVTARVQPAVAASPWLPLRDAAPLLRFSSARALRNRIHSGRFPQDCYRCMPSATGQRTRYVVNVDRYLRSLR